MPVSITRWILPVLVLIGALYYAYHKLRVGLTHWPGNAAATLFKFDSTVEFVYREIHRMTVTTGVFINYQCFCAD